MADIAQYFTKYLCIEPPPSDASLWAHTLISCRLDRAEITRRAGGTTCTGEGLRFIPFFSPNDPTGLIGTYAHCRRRRRSSFINIVDRCHSPDERWMSVLSLPFIIDSFCRSDLVSRRLAPLCQSAVWRVCERLHVRAHWDWCHRMKANGAASCTMGPILISLLGLLPSYYRKSFQLTDVMQRGSIALSERTFWGKWANLISFGRETGKKTCPPHPL